MTRILEFYFDYLSPYSDLADWPWTFETDVPPWVEN